MVTLLSMPISVFAENTSVPKEAVETISLYYTNLLKGNIGQAAELYLTPSEQDADDIKEKMKAYYFDHGKDISNFTILESSQVDKQKIFFRVQLTYKNNQSSTDEIIAYHDLKSGLWKVSYDLIDDYLNKIVANKPLETLTPEEAVRRFYLSILNENYGDVAQLLYLDKEQKKKSLDKLTEKVSEYFSDTVSFAITSVEFVRDVSENEKLFRVTINNNRPIHSVLEEDEQSVVNVSTVKEDGVWKVKLLGEEETAKETSNPAPDSLDELISEILSVVLVSMGGMIIVFIIITVLRRHWALHEEDSTRRINIEPVTNNTNSSRPTQDIERGINNLLEELESTQRESSVIEHASENTIDTSTNARGRKITVSDDDRENDVIKTEEEYKPGDRILY